MNFRFSSFRNAATHFLATAFVVLAVFTPYFTNAQSYKPTWSSIDARPTPKWYQDAKFGIFIHWGVYSVPAWAPKGQYAEWYQHALQENDFNGQVKAYHNKKYGASVKYYALARLFKATLFEPDEWAKLFEKSGAKYVVLTSKHHDGFAMWPSKEASKTRGFPWNAAEVGPKKDLLGDLFTAIRKTSLHPGIYYSMFEWYNPLWLRNKPAYVKTHVIPQIKDVVTRYKPEVFWTDGEWLLSDTAWRSRDILAWLFNNSPVKDQVVVNDRWGKDTRFRHGGFYTPEYQPDIDFKNHYFEESRGMGFSYGFNMAEDAWDYNDAHVLLLQLIDKVSRGGNFLLDIGPTGDGKIPPIMQERLLQMGAWLKINGEAIYGTHRWKEPFQWSGGRQDYRRPPNETRISGDIMLKLTSDPDPGYAVKEVFFTTKGKKLYAILPVWPKSGTVVLKNIHLSSKGLTLLETKQKLNFNIVGNNTVVHLPPYYPGEFKSDLAYVLKIEL